jgi:hypothetical protein
MICGAIGLDAVGAGMVVPSVMGVVGLLGRTAQHRTSRAKRPAARMSRRFKALRSSACRHAAPPTRFLPMPLHLAAATSARSYNASEFTGCRALQLVAQSRWYGQFARVEESIVGVRHGKWISGAVCALFVVACSEQPSPSAPPSTSSANSPPPAVAPDRSAQSVGTGDGPPVRRWTQVREPSTVRQRARWNR